MELGQELGKASAPADDDSIPVPPSNPPDSDSLLAEVQNHHRRPPGFGRSQGPSEE